jgi:16S rRNA (cytidine1402-2'-O)-methyltransferase
MTESGGKYTQGLYLIATPIGNMGDLTHRAADALGKLDVLACEDTRETAKIINANGARVQTIPYHDHNADHIRPKIIAMIASGKSVGLVSDAGMPLISDPGYKLVQDCIAAGLPVTCLPGASALLTALVLSGLPSDRFFFAGFLPAKSAARKTALAEISAVPATLIFYEGASRVDDSLADMLQVLGDRQAAVARELTKKFEEVRRGALSELADFYAAAEDPRGEIVIVVGAPLPVTAEDMQSGIEVQLRTALATMTVKDAAAHVAACTGARKKDVYARALDLVKTLENKT